MKTMRDEDHEVCNEQDYVEALGIAAEASELARTPGKSVKFSTADSSPEEVTSPTRGSKMLFGLGSKRTLLEKFRTSMLLGSIHVVINGFFPSITIRSILNSVTEEVLEYEGHFHNPLDQMDFIVKTLKEDPDLQLFLLIHNIDGQMLRGDKTQQILGQLAAIPNLHLIASIDHINAPLWLSFQDFYQCCREAFLVNSDITLRTQLTEFRDHKLIRAKKGADGVEYLIIPIETGTLTDFLEKEDKE
ncbi:UNVERIFIED_CONTAM: hypothetical protein FKN15_041848 [Acipenser sinensis]